MTDLNSVLHKIVDAVLGHEDRAAAHEAVDAEVPATAPPEAAPEPVASDATAAASAPAQAIDYDALAAAIARQNQGASQ